MKLKIQEKTIYTKIWKGSHIEPLTVNQFFIINPEFSTNYEDKKRGLFHENTEKSPCVHPAGIEPTSSEPESDILSIELRVQLSRQR